MGDGSGELVRHVPDGRRREAPAALLGSHHLRGIAMVGVGVGEDRDTAGSRVAVPVGTGNGGIRQLMFRDEDVRGESCGDAAVG